MKKIIFVSALLAITILVLIVASNLRLGSLPTVVNRKESAEPMGESPALVSAKSNLRLNPSSGEANLIVAEILLSEKIDSGPEALSYLEKSEELGANKERIYAARLSVEMREADWDAVIDYSKKLLALDENNYKARFAISEALMETNGSPEEIITHAEKALESKLAIREYVLQTLALAHLRSGNKARALELINEAQVVNRDSCLLFLSKARILSSLSMHDEATENIIRAEQTSEEYDNDALSKVCKAAAFSTKGDLFVALGDKSAAEKEYRAALEIDLPQPKKFNEIYRKSASAYFGKSNE